MTNLHLVVLINCLMYQFLELIKYVTNFLNFIQIIGCFHSKEMIKNQYLLHFFPSYFMLFLHCPNYFIHLIILILINVVLMILYICMTLTRYMIMIIILILMYPLILLGHSNVLYSMFYSIVLLNQYHPDLTNFNLPILN